MDSRLYWIWLQQALSPGFIASHQILRIFNDAFEVYDAPADTFEIAGLTSLQKKRLCDKSLDQAKGILSASLKNNGWILTPEDKYYPDLLRSIPALPLVLYGRGEMPPLDIIPAISIVGTRESSAFGRRATALVAGGLALGGMAVISGGARGIDSIAHRACLEAGGITVAVQGCGLDVNYPKENAALRDEICRRGAVITEYPPGTPPAGSNFPVRNRIMSGLSVGVVIVEAPERSGALITARHGSEQGRDVFAVAGDMLTKRSPGTDSLIRSGATLITDAREILEEYKSRFPEVIRPERAKGVFRNEKFDTRRYENEIKTQSIHKNKENKSRKKDKKPAGAVDNINKTVPNNSAAGYSESKFPDYLSEETKRIYNILTKEPSALGNIIERAEMPASRVLASLTELELLGLVSALPGQSYAKR